MIVSVFQKELGYAPCRDENCDLDFVHPEHFVEPKKTGRAPRTCPQCLGKVKDGLCTKCGWRRPVVVQAPRPSYALSIEQIMRHTSIVRQITTEDGTVILTEYRCPSHSRGGCSGRGWRKTPAKPCRVCNGAGTVRWTFDQMRTFLSTPAYARGRR